MELLLKALAGAAVVLVISLLSRSKSYYIAGLVPLFPTFALISHLIVGRERTTAELRETIVFGMLALIPYFVYLAALYYLVARFKLETSLIGAILLWIVSAMGLVLIWARR